MLQFRNESFGINRPKDFRHWPQHRSNFQLAFRYFYSKRKIKNHAFNFYHVGVYRRVFFFLPTVRSSCNASNESTLCTEFHASYWERERERKKYAHNCFSLCCFRCIAVCVKKAFYVKWNLRVWISVFDGGFIGSDKYINCIFMKLSVIFYRYCGRCFHLVWSFDDHDGIGNDGIVIWDEEKKNELILSLSVYASKKSDRKWDGVEKVRLCLSSRFIFNTYIFSMTVDLNFHSVQQVV